MTSLLRIAGAFALGALACGARTNLGGIASTHDAGVDASFPIGTTRIAHLAPSHRVRS